LKLFVYYTSSVVSWMIFVAVDTFDFVIFYISGTLAGLVSSCAFHAPWGVSIVVFRVSVFFATCTLGDLPFNVWRFRSNYHV